MDGTWRVQLAGEPIRDDHRIRLILANEDWQAVGYQLGVVELIRTSEESRVTGHLGPDLLGSDWDSDEAVRRLSAEPDRPIGEALLDQKNLAGLGTWFCAEMLFLRGIDPWRPAGSVEDLDALADLGHRLLDANKTRPGHTSTGDLRPGRESWVYGRAGRPCRRCGTVIRRGEQGPPGQERLRFWCPNCQK
jgi:endonuclease-8